MGRRLRALLLCALVAEACGTPITPTANQGAAAILVISSLTLTADSSGSDLAYMMTYQLRETSGVTGLTVTAVKSLIQGTSPTIFLPFDNLRPGATVRIEAGGTLAPPQVRLAAPEVFRQITLTVSYNDDGGHVGAISASATP